MKACVVLAFCLLASGALAARIKPQELWNEARVLLATNNTANATSPSPSPSPSKPPGPGEWPPGSEGWAEAPYIIKTNEVAPAPVLRPTEMSQAMVMAGDNIPNTSVDMAECDDGAGNGCTPILE